jgi:hypothetical protein
MTVADSDWLSDLSYEHSIQGSHSVPDVWLLSPDDIDTYSLIYVSDVTPFSQKN